MQWFLSLDPWLKATLVSLLLFTATSLGASLVFLAGKCRGGLLTALTAVSAGIMLAASFFSLLLPALSYPSALPPYVTVTLSFLIGGLFILLSDLLTKKRPRAGGMDQKSKLIYAAVTLHNIPEGMAVGVAFAAAGFEAGAVFSALLFAVGIAVQNFPEGACVAFPLKARGMPAFKSFLFSVGSGAVEIPACILGAVAATFITGLLPWALAFSAGAMVSVVCSELVPECFTENKAASTVATVIGFCLMMLLDVALG